MTSRSRQGFQFIDIRPAHLDFIAWVMGRTPDSRADFGRRWSIATSFRWAWRSLTPRTSAFCMHTSASGWKVYPKGNPAAYVQFTCAPAHKGAGLCGGGREHRRVGQAAALGSTQKADKRHEFGPRLQNRSDEGKNLIAVLGAIGPIISISASLAGAAVSAAAMSAQADSEEQMAKVNADRQREQAALEQSKGAIESARARRKAARRAAMAQPTFAQGGARPIRGHRCYLSRSSRRRPPGAPTWK